MSTSGQIQVLEGLGEALDHLVVDVLVVVVVGFLREIAPPEVKG